MNKIIIVILLALFIITPLTQVLAYGTNNRFTGQLFDPTANLYDYGARSYQADIGRFTQPDPVSRYLTDPQKLKQSTGQDLQQFLTNPQALNEYSYTQNNPVIKVDPEGEFNFETNQVEVGDTLRGVFGNNWQEVANYNKLENPNLIHPGQHLDIPAAIKQGFFDYFFNTLTAFAPIASDIRDAIEVKSGKNLITGRALTQGERDLTGSGLLVGLVLSGSQLRGLNKVGQAFDNLDNLSFTGHGIDQIISRGVKPSDIKDAMKYPIKIVQRIDNLGRSSFRYFGSHAMVAINKAREVVTTWRLHK